MDKGGMGGILYEVHAVFYANDHPAFNELCDTILSCILAIRLYCVGFGHVTREPCS